jgi:hypothetical protein
VYHVRALTTKESIQTPNQPEIVPLASMELEEPDVRAKQALDGIGGTGAADAAAHRFRWKPVHELDDTELHTVWLELEKDVHHPDVRPRLCGIQSGFQGDCTL